MDCIGTDIIEIARFRKAITRWGDSLLRRVYTGAEIDLYQKKLPSLAARFAAKEAVIKALGKPAGVNLRQVEVLSDATGRPTVNLYGAALKQAKDLGLTGFAVSLSHSREYAIAMVIGQTK